MERLTCWPVLTGGSGCGQQGAVWMLSRGVTERPVGVKLDLLS